MNNRHLNHSALEECLQTLNHLFIDIARLTYDQSYEEFVGGYSEVKVAALDSGTPTVKIVAAKKLRLKGRQAEPKRLAFRLARELKVWAGLQHPHVLPLLGFYLASDYKSALLISEYMDRGNLHDHLANKKPPFNERLHLVRDLTDGLVYLHTQHAPIRHGDLKPGNILVNLDCRALLANFGLSKALDDGPKGLTTDNDLRCTTRYSSPEVLFQTSTESLPDDIWPWGCIVQEALTDMIPFDGIRSEPLLVIAQSKGTSPYDAENLSVCPQPLGDLLAKCWSRQPNKRPTAVDCLGIIESTLSSLIQVASSEAGPSLEFNPMDNTELLESPGGSRLRIGKWAFTSAWAVPPRVLLVDDDQVSRKLFGTFLQVSGCTIDVAIDGIGAVNKMNLEKYDLVLMDIVMPRLDGVSATTLIRQFDHTTPIIAITSNSKPKDVVTYYSSGMNDILPKPFTRESLFTMLEKYLMHLKAITMVRPVAEEPTKSLFEDQYWSMPNFLGMTDERNGFPPLGLSVSPVQDRVWFH